MLKNDFPGAAAGKPHRLHPLGLLLGKGLAPGDPCVLGPGNGRQGDDGVLQSAPQGPGHRQGEHQPRKGQKHIGNTHQHRVRQAPDPAAGDPHRRSQGGDDRHQQKGGKNTGTAPGDHSGQHIPAVPVRAQRMGPGGRLLGNVQILQIGVIRGQIGRKEGAENQQQPEGPKDRQTGFDPAFVQSHPSCTPNRILGSSTW